MGSSIRNVTTNPKAASTLSTSSRRSGPSRGGCLGRPRYHQSRV